MSNGFRKVGSCFCARSSVTALAQQSHWATTDDPTAKFIIDSERQWAESGCNSGKETKILADDFQGTSPRDARYTKADAYWRGTPTRAKPRQIAGCSTPESVYSLPATATMSPWSMAARPQPRKKKAASPWRTASPGPIPG